MKVTEGPIRRKEGQTGEKPEKKKPGKMRRNLLKLHLGRLWVLKKKEKKGYEGKKETFSDDKA